MSLIWHKSKVKVFYKSHGKRLALLSSEAGTSAHHRIQKLVNF